MDDPVIQCIERFRCTRGTLFAERRNRGYTLYSARSGVPVARLRPAGADDTFEVLYWSLWKNRWPPRDRSDEPSYRLMTPYASSHTRTSSGL